MVLPPALKLAGAAWKAVIGTRCRKLVGIAGLRPSFELRNQVGDGAILAGVPGARPRSHRKRAANLGGENAGVMAKSLAK
jgi:hypothetical protein